MFLLHLWKKMCRLFLSVGKNVSADVLDEYLGSCSDYIGEAKLDIHERNETKLEQHRDGYGFAFLKDDHFEIKRYKEPIFERNPKDELQKMKTDVLFIVSSSFLKCPKYNLIIINFEIYYYMTG